MGRGRLERNGGGIVLLVIGSAVVVALIWAVRLGISVRRREAPTPRPQEQPRLPDSGPVREVREMREPDEVPRAQNPGERLTHHQLNGHSRSTSKRSDDQSRPRRSPGSSGSFGAGGPGHS
ncbi:DUF6479 family protein [Streptomyces sp. NPDC001982]|uniref:DUF6479 family protein n=1 Tax=Streptomyces sp. NPDC001982 TaxID=3154405 RepID=UPI003316FC97